jgi:hypothetical protein
MLLGIYYFSSYSLFKSLSRSVTSPETLIPTYLLAIWFGTLIRSLGWSSKFEGLSGLWSAFE